MAAAEAESVRQERIRQAKANMQVHNATVIATFAKRAKDKSIAARVAAKEVEAAGQAATVDAETVFADSMAMQE